MGETSNGGSKKERECMRVGESVCDRLRVSVLEIGFAQGQASSRPQDTQSSMEREGSLPPNYCISLCTSLPISMCAYFSRATDAYTCPNTTSLAGKLCTKSSVSEAKAEGWRTDER